MSKAAVQRIRRAREAGMTSLDLSALKLTTVPSEVTQLTVLQSLSLSGNRLENPPEEITHLTGLQTLHLDRNWLRKPPARLDRLTSLRELALGDNRLAEVPTEIAELRSLERLDLANNQLTALPLEVTRVRSLRALDLRNNQLTELPEEIGELRELRALFLSGNQLSSLPASLGQLTELRTLYVDGNQLTSLPPELGRLKALRKLHLADNRLASLPAELGGLEALRFLHLGRNQLAEVPPAISKLEQLDTVYLHGNEALGIPPEVLGPRASEKGLVPARPTDVLAYYFKSCREASSLLLEAKVLVLGQGDVGKTSLVKRLVRNQFDPEEQKTNGIDIEHWKVPGKDDKKVRVNLWDFGGQEIMHATHQFFLTKRSLYVVVLDARKGENESNAHYWLRIIESYGGDSPVLVVTNKCDGANNLDLDQYRLKKDFPAIRAFYKTSCKDGSGIGKLREAIQREIQQIEHVYNVVPDSYLKVKADLEAKTHTQDYFEISEYEELCEEHGVTTPADQTRLLRFLHDLGSVLHFADPDSPYRLEETKILNPRWVTRGVYKVLNHRPFAEKGGVLKRSDFERVLKAEDGYPGKARLFILGMMQRFELSFEFSDGTHRHLVPELLPKNEPELDLDPREALRFEYHYPILPEGLVPRFIVRMEAHLTEGSVYWRRGVLVEIDGNRALVRGDLQAHRIYVSVFGTPAGRRRALAVIRAAFQAIHRTIPGLQGKEMIPLPDDPGKAVSYDHLLKLEAAGQTQHWPEGAEKAYGVASLLAGIETPADREERRLALRESLGIGSGPIHVSGDLVIAEQPEPITINPQLVLRDLDLQSLALDLAQLRGRLELRSGMEPEAVVELDAVREAEQAALDGDGSRAIEQLRRAGRGLVQFTKEMTFNVLANVVTNIFHLA